MRLGRLTRVIRVTGVDVYVHWSVLLIGTLMLLAALRRPVLTLMGSAAYLSVLLIHECVSIVEMNAPMAPISR